MNIPDCFKNSKIILFAGIGGGFDIFTAIPIWTNLRTKDYKFVFSNYNGNTKEFTNNPTSYPEKELNDILVKNETNIPLYVLPKMGVKAYVQMYQQIINEHKIDTIVAIDGGIDSLMRGNEEGAGTILEDFVNMIALNQIKVDHKYLVCAGFGAELEEDVCHHHALENIANLTENNALVGTCSLVKNTIEFDMYKKICDYCWKENRKSHIQTKIISAATGKFGNTNLYENIQANIMGNLQTKNYISPLMNIYWFFHLDKVVENNMLKDILMGTMTATDVLMVYRQNIDKIKLRPRKPLPY